MSPAGAAVGPGSAPRIGRYEIIGPLAEGGMAEILLGRVPGERGFARAVVIKRVLRHLSRTQQFETMFLDEARIVSGIHHPNVVQVFDLGRDGDELFMVMEYLEGESAAGLMRRLALLGDKLDPYLAAHVLAEIAAGLHAAHELTTADGDPQNLVHRDVNPQNAFIGYDGSVKLLDFGVAKAADAAGHTEAGQVKGKFGYMSPEQCGGRPLDRRSDIFALGIVLYEMGTGHRLFHRPSAMLTFRAICSDRLAPPSEVRADFPPSLEAVCMKALERERTRRYATAAEMRRDLLTVQREGAQDEPAAERLAALMRRVFSDRIEEKTELMRRVRSGSAVTAIPPAEIDLGAELPSVVAELDPAGVAQPSESTARRASRLVWWVGALAATGALAAAWVLAGQRATTARGSSDEATTAQAAEAPAPASASSAAAAASIALHIVTEPPGARVVVAGTEHGTTPLEISIPRGADAIGIELSRDGYTTLVEPVVPDRDQKLRLTLSPKASVEPDGPRSGKPPPSAHALPRKPAPEPPPTPASNAVPTASGRSGYYQF